MVTNVSENLSNYRVIIRVGGAYELTKRTD